MLTQREEKFIAWWQQNREKEKKTLRQLYFGLPAGLAMGYGILLSVISSTWYESANMEVNSKMNPHVIFIAVSIIAVFIAIFSKKYKWDMNEQNYRELTAKKQAAEKAADSIQTQSEQKAP